MKFTPLNCNSMVNGMCVKHVRRGQSVTLCTSHTTTPSTIPQGKHLVGVSVLYWLQPYMEDGSNSSTYYTCGNYHRNCKPTHSIMNFTHHLDVGESCFTIDNVQESRKYEFVAHFNTNDAKAKVCFKVICGGM